jgi:hypothetical protein
MRPEPGLCCTEVAAAKSGVCADAFTTLTRGVANASAKCLGDACVLGVSQRFSLYTDEVGVAEGLGRL